jgi:hypothetical protein
LLASIEVGAAQQSKVPQTAWEEAKKEGVVRVIVTLTVEEIPEGKLTREARDAQRQAIAAGQDRLIAELKGTKHRIIRKGLISNYVIMEVSVDALSVLERSSLVRRVTADRFLKFWSRCGRRIGLAGRLGVSSGSPLPSLAPVLSMPSSPDTFRKRGR